MASAFSTLAATAAQASTARWHQLVAALPNQRQISRPPQGTEDDLSQPSGSRRLFGFLPQAVWPRLSARFGQSRPSAASNDGVLQPTAASKLSQPTSGCLDQVDQSIVGDSKHLQRSFNSTGSGSRHERQEDEWGRPIVHLQAASEPIAQQHQVSETGESANGATGTVLWVRMDPEEHDSSNGDKLQSSKQGSQVTRSQKDGTNGHAGQNVRAVPRRFRPSRLARHEVSIEALLDNVE